MIKTFLSSFEKFVKSESLGGVMLFSATVIALIWANSPYGTYYENLWQMKLGFSFHNFGLNKPLILWINDGLMAIFFFLIGLELKREILIGEINSVKKASFPLIAALGGVVIPIILYLTLNSSPETAKGWGIPMATDIAFALAILTALGKRIPLSLKVFLTAFAIIDDIAAVLVIAIFYSDNINWMLIVYALILIGLLGIFFNKKKYSFTLGIITGTVVWFLFLKSGIHPTIAGVLLAFTIPIKRKLEVKTFSERLNSISAKLFGSDKNEEKHLLSHDEIEQLDHLDELTEDVRSPLQHLEHNLHGFIAYFVLPIFAFSNAGVEINTQFDFNYSLMINIAVSLFVGKFIGVSLFSYLGVKFGITELPSKVNFKHILGIAFLAGVGFTMSIFIDNLAFAGDLIKINSAKVGVIIGSVISGITGYAVLRMLKNENEF